MVRRTLHSPFFTSVPRNSHLANKSEVGGAFILPEDMTAVPKREIPVSKFRLVFGGEGGSVLFPPNPPRICSYCKVNYTLSCLPFEILVFLIQHLLLHG